MLHAQGPAGPLIQAMELRAVKQVNKAFEVLLLYIYIFIIIYMYYWVNMLYIFMKYVVYML